MTVRNTNYSSLDEVWGDTQTITASSKNTKRKEKREKRDRFEPPKVVDPICELYEMGNYRGYNENDIINYANEYHDKYFEKEHTRPHVAASHANGNRSYEDDYDNEDKDYRQQETKPETNQHERDAPTPNYHQERPESYRKNKVRYVDDDEPTKEHNEFAFIDLLLYIVSGIILIFVMEQFVKIGLLLQ
jgi:hypothetical protein